MTRRRRRAAQGRAWLIFRLRGAFQLFREEALAGPEAEAARASVNALLVKLGATPEEMEDD